MGKVIAIGSGKGGTGKTTVSSNVGIELAKLDEDVLIIDADVPMPNLTTIMGIENPPFTLQDVLNEEIDTEDAIYKTHGLSILPSDPSLEKFANSDMDEFGRIVEEVREDYDFVIIDTTSGLNEYAIEAMKAADETLLVVAPNSLSISDAIKLKNAGDYMEIITDRAIINKMTEVSFLEKLLLVLTEDISQTLSGKSRWRSSIAREKEAIEKLGAEVLDEIPEDRNVKMAAENQKPVVKFSPRCRASIALRSIARKISEIY